MSKIYLEKIKRIEDSLKSAKSSLLKDSKNTSLISGNFKRLEHSISNLSSVVKHISDNPEHSGLFSASSFRNDFDEKINDMDKDILKLFEIVSKDTDTLCTLADKKRPDVNP